MLKFKFRCPDCGKKISAPVEKAGLRARCPRCGRSFELPRIVDAESGEPLAPGSLAASVGPPAATASNETSAVAVGAPPGHNVWALLLLLVCPLTLGLGLLAGYVLRPYTPEQLLAKARRDAERIKADAEAEARRLLERAEAAAGSAMPGSAVPSVGESARPPEQPTRAERAYLKQIELEDVHVGKSVFDTDTLFGQIHNAGRQTVRRVALTVACLDKNGSPLAEMTFYPVQAGEDAIGLSPPLQPGERRLFSLSLADAPADWSGKVEVRVSSVAF